MIKVNSPLPDSAPPVVLVADYQLTLDDLKAARNLHSGRKPWTRVVSAIGLFVIVFGLALSFWLWGQFPPGALA